MSDTRGEHPDWQILRKVGAALEKSNHGLTQVRRDSPEWSAWRLWMRDRGMPTRWYDKHPPEHLITVTIPYPPTDEELLKPADLIRKHSKQDSKGLKE